MSGVQNSAAIVPKSLPAIPAPGAKFGMAISANAALKKLGDGFKVSREFVDEYSYPLMGAALGSYAIGWALKPIGRMARHVGPAITEVSEEFSSRRQADFDKRFSRLSKRYIARGNISELAQATANPESFFKERIQSRRIALEQQLAILQHEDALKGALGNRTFGFVHTPHKIPVLHTSEPNFPTTNYVIQPNGRESSGFRLHRIFETGEGASYDTLPLRDPKTFVPNGRSIILGSESFVPAHINELQNTALRTYRSVRSYPPSTEQLPRLGDMREAEGYFLEKQAHQMELVTNAEGKLATLSTLEKDAGELTKLERQMKSLASLGEKGKLVSRYLRFVKPIGLGFRILGLGIGGLVILNTAATAVQNYRRSGNHVDTRFWNGIVDGATDFLSATLIPDPTSYTNELMKHYAHNGIGWLKQKDSFDRKQMRQRDLVTSDLAFA